MNLSIILPTLDKTGTARNLAVRFRELFPALKIEVVVVTPREAEGILEPGIRVVRDRGGGVYAAYTLGLKAARGDYVWLVGDDDYPLDAAARLAPVILAGEADLIVAPVIFSSGRVYRPHRSKLLLLFFNWCQQGVIYRREALGGRRFYRRLRVQADHYVNVLMRADEALRKIYFDEPICVFGAHGVSSRNGDLKFRELRPRLARRTLGYFGFLAFEGIVGVMSVRKWRGRPRA